jgi:hypothetical protein
MALSGLVRSLQQVARYLLTKLDIFSMFADKEWKRVADATGIPFQYHSSRRLSGALKWKAEFENILREQVISDVIPLNSRAYDI